MPYFILALGGQAITSGQHWGLFNNDIYNDIICYCEINAKLMPELSVTAN